MSPAEGRFGGREHFYNFYFLTRRLLMNIRGKWALFCRCFLEGHFDISNGRFAAVIKMQRSDQVA